MAMTPLSLLCEQRALAEDSAPACSICRVHTKTQEQIGESYALRRSFHSSEGPIRLSVSFYEYDSFLSQHPVRR
jgi:hypothetical protein